MQAGNDPYPDTPAQIQADQYRPSLQPYDNTAGYVKSKKDITLSFLKDTDIFLGVFWGNIANQCVDMGLSDCATMHAEECFWWSNLLRARDGFERKEQGKTKIEGKIDYPGKAPTQLMMPNP